MDLNEQATSSICTSSYKLITIQDLICTYNVKPSNYELSSLQLMVECFNEMNQLKSLLLYNIQIHVFEHSFEDNTSDTIANYFFIGEYSDAKKEFNDVNSTLTENEVEILTSLQTLYKRLMLLNKGLRSPFLITCNIRVGERILYAREQRRSIQFS